MSRAAPIPDPETQSRHYQLVARAIDYLHRHALEQPALSDVAAAVHVSEHHFQRIFSQWAGVSPKRFLQYLSKQRALAALRRSDDLLSAAAAAGVSGPGRLHDLMITTEALTPGEIRASGRGVALHYGWTPTPFGEALVAWSERGLCHLAFGDECPEEALISLRNAWPAAQWCDDPAGARAYATRIFGESAAHPPGVSQPLHVILKGTNFQIKVWEALLRIPLGELATYSQLATLAGAPNSQRAVGSALAANRIGYLIPCHRVIRRTGEFGEYRWGRERKAALQGWEAARHERSMAHVEIQRRDTNAGEGE